METRIPGSSRVYYPDIQWKNNRSQVSNKGDDEDCTPTLSCQLWHTCDSIQILKVTRTKFVYVSHYWTETCLAYVDFRKGSQLHFYIVPGTFGR